jgi:hypothetical protein
LEVQASGGVRLRVIAVGPGWTVDGVDRVDCRPAGGSSAD